MRDSVLFSLISSYFPGNGSFISLERLNLNSKISPKKKSFDNLMQILGALKFEASYLRV